MRNINDDVIEINFSELSPTKRLELLKLVYQNYRDDLLEAKKHGEMLEPDDNIRKTYHIKSDIVQAFSKDAEKKNVKIGDHVSSLLSKCLNAIDEGAAIPLPAKPEKDARYEKKSYRVRYSLATRFDTVCSANKVPVGNVLQTLMENHLNEEGSHD